MAPKQVDPPQVISESRPKPNYGFDLFSRHMLSHDKFKELQIPERDRQLSFLWDQLSDKDKTDYHTEAEKVFIKVLL